MATGGRGCRRPRHIRGRGPLDTSPEGAQETVGRTEWSAAERSPTDACGSAQSLATVGYKQYPSGGKIWLMLGLETTGSDYSVRLLYTEG